MSQAVVPFRPALLRAADGVDALIADTADADPLYLTTADKAELLVALERQITQLEARRARTLAVSDDVAEQSGARDAGAWLAHTTRQDPAAGRAAQRLAAGLSRWPQVAQAYAAGAVSTAQVKVIAEGARRTPHRP